MTITLVAPDWQAVWQPDLGRVLEALEPPLWLPTDYMLSTGSTLPNSKLACFTISMSYFKLAAAQKDLSSQW